MAEELPVGIGLIVVCGDLRLRNTLIRAIQAAGGPSPVRKGNTKAVKRAYYDPAQTRVIINAASPEIQEKLGPHCGVATITVGNPAAAAESARKVFQEAGYLARVHTDAEPGLPDGFMAFLSVPALNGILLLFWPKMPDLDAVRRYTQSGDFGDWSNEELQS